MIIKKDWKIKYRNAETKEITCEVLFKVVDDNRKVPIETTGFIICEIKKWIQFYEKILPTTAKENYQEVEKYLSLWKFRLNILIPENTAISELVFNADGELVFDGDFTKQHFVKLIYKLLEPNKLLTYNEALFLLLGLNAIALGKEIKDFPVLDGDIPNEPIEKVFWETPQNQALRSSAYIKDGKITSENLLKLAKDNGFSLEPKTTHESTVKKNKNIEKVEKALLKYLETIKKKTNINALAENKRHDDFSQQFDFPRSSLVKYLTEIITLEWWIKQEKDIQKNIKKPKK